MESEERETKRNQITKQTNKQTKTYRHTETGLYKVHVPARQLLTDKRRAPSAPSPRQAAF